MNILFRLFGDERFAKSDLVNDIYPPISLRRLMATHATLKAVLNLWNNKLLDQTATALRRAIDDTDTAFAKIMGDSSKGGGWDDAFGPAGEKHQKLCLFAVSSGLE